MVKMNMCIVAGARPNFMKIAPIIEAINIHNREAKADSAKIDYTLVHTGQHYDHKMSELFFDNLGIPAPDVDLEVGSASHSVQTAEIMKGFEKVCIDKKPSHILVVGDVNSTIACALVAAKMQIEVIHVEAGLRSFDRSMPEEINRILTDAISNILFTTEESANENLKKEGIPEDKIYFVGNVMIDTLLKHQERAKQSNICRRLGIVEKDIKGKPEGYVLVTLHRPSNVDNKKYFSEIIEALSIISKEIPIIWPLHPRTLQSIKKFKMEQMFEWILDTGSSPNILRKHIYCIEPLGYLDFIKLMTNSKLVLTDSGGIQEETTILNIPCVTIRENTERPITLVMGTNVLARTEKNSITDNAWRQLEIGEDIKHTKSTLIPPLWDGKAATRIVDILARSNEL